MGCSAGLFYLKLYMWLFETFGREHFDKIFKMMQDRSRDSSQLTIMRELQCELVRYREDRVSVSPDVEYVHRWVDQAVERLDKSVGVLGAGLDVYLERAIAPNGGIDHDILASINCRDAV